jgi:hypothetical protein
VTAPIRSDKTCSAHPGEAVFTRPGEPGFYHLRGCCGGSLVACGGELQ